MSTSTRPPVSAATWKPQRTLRANDSRTLRTSDESADDVRKP